MKTFIYLLCLVTLTPLASRACPLALETPSEFRVRRITARPNSEFEMREHGFYKSRRRGDAELELRLTGGKFEQDFTSTVNCFSRQGRYEVVRIRLVDLRSRRILWSDSAHVLRCPGESVADQTKEYNRSVAFTLSAAMPRCEDIQDKL